MISQIVGSYKFIKPKLLRYHQHDKELLKQILRAIIYQPPWVKNSMADALAKMAKEMSCPTNELYW